MAFLRLYFFMHQTVTKFSLNLLHFRSKRVIGSFGCKPKSFGKISLKSIVSQEDPIENEPSVVGSGGGLDALAPEDGSPHVRQLDEPARLVNPKRIPTPRESA